MKEYTVIWDDIWYNGIGNQYQMTRKTFVRCNSIEDLMQSEYGAVCQFIFEGFIPTLGEEIKEEDIKTI